MSDQATNPSSGAEDVKGKGKSPAVHEEMSMDEADEESDSDEEPHGDPEEEDDDNMEEISTENIVSGGRQRNKVDYAKAAEETKDLEDDEEDDDDFVEPVDEDQMEE